MPKKGLEYEKLIENIYKALEKDAIVKHNEHLKGHTSGILRQIDVTIRPKMHSLETLIIVEAKDLNKRVNVNTVHTLVGVKKDVRADKAILISSKGFSKPAMNEARAENITLLSAHDALRKEWQDEIKIPFIINHRKYRSTIEISIVIAGEGGKPMEFGQETLLSVDDGATTFVVETLALYVDKNTLLLNGENKTDLIIPNLKTWCGRFVGWKNTTATVVTEIYEDNKKYYYYTLEMYQGMKNHFSGEYAFSKAEIDALKLYKIEEWKTLNKKALEKIENHPLEPVKMDYYDLGFAFSSTMEVKHFNTVKNFFQVKLHDDHLE